MKENPELLNDVETEIENAVAAIEATIDSIMRIQPPLLKGLSYGQIGWLMNQSAFLSGKTQELRQLIELLIQGRNL